MAIVSWVVKVLDATRNRVVSGLTSFSVSTRSVEFDIGDKMYPQAGFRVGLERLADHLGTQVRAADADVDHIADRLAGIALPLPGAHGLG